MDPNNSYQSPDATGPAPMYPQPATSQPISQGKAPKVGLNPFKHFMKGAKGLFSTNIVVVLVAGLLGSAISVISAIIFTALGMGFIFTDTIGSSKTNLIIKVIVSVFVYLVVLVVSSTFFSLVTLRVLILSVRRQKVSIKELLQFGAQRFMKATITLATVFGIPFAAYIAFFVLAALLGMISSTLATIFGLLMGLAGLIAGLIYFFRMSYVTFILADDNPPEGTGAIIKRSSSLWKKSGNALFLYALILGGMYLALSIPLSSHSSSSMSNSNSSAVNIFTGQKVAGAGLVTGALIVTSTLTNLVGLVVGAGTANIYNVARVIEDGITPTVSTGPVPFNPVPAYQQPANTQFNPVANAPISFTPAAPTPVATPMPEQVVAPPFVQPTPEPIAPPDSQPPLPPQPGPTV